MNDVHLIKKWERCLELEDAYKLQINIRSGFELKKKNGQFLGGFDTVEALYYFLLGYDWGWNNGVNASPGSSDQS